MVVLVVLEVDCGGGGGKVTLVGLDIRGRTGG